MPKITIKINKKAETTVEVSNVSGPSCTGSSAPYIKALGQTITDEQKPEYFENETINEGQTA